jgi:adenosylcobinamide-phosphate synthase
VEELVALGMAAGFDLVIGEPPTFFHPVVWMGKVIQALERISPKTGQTVQFLFGLLTAVSVPALFGAASFFLLHDVTFTAFILVGAWLLKSTVAVKALGDAASTVQRNLQVNEIEKARAGLISLVSRDRSELTHEQACSAAVESVAENTTDSFAAPLFYFAVFGIVGAMVYKAINTADSMIGYHGRYEHLGKAAARLDDAVNYIPARICGMLIVIASAVSGRNAAGAWRTMMREHGRTESPNAGWTMSAMAGALGIRLQKAGNYALGENGRAPSPPDISKAIRLMLIVFGFMLGITVAVFFLRYALIGGLP